MGEPSVKTTDKAIKLKQLAVVKKSRENFKLHCGPITPDIPFAFMNIAAKHQTKVKNPKKEPEKLLK